MKDVLKKILKYTLSIALAGALLWVSFRGVKWADFLSSIKECRWEWIILSMVAGAFAFWLRGLRWHQLLIPFDKSVSRLTTFNGINIGNISNFLFPRIGEFVRCGVIVRRSSISYDKVLGTVVLERGWELLVMLMMIAVVLVFGFDRFGSFFIERIWNPLAQRFDSSLWWILIGAVVLGFMALGLIWRLRESNNLCAKIWKVFKGVGQGFASCLKMDRKWLFFAYTLLIWMTYWFMAYAIVKAAPFLDHLDAIDALFLSLVGGLSFAVPVPAGIGAFHFMISMTLSVMYEVPVELGVVYATLSHTSQAITQIIFGLGSYAHEAVSSK